MVCPPPDMPKKSDMHDKMGMDPHDAKGMDSAATYGKGGDMKKGDMKKELPAPPPCYTIQVRPTCSHCHRDSLSTQRALSATWRRAVWRWSCQLPCFPSTSMVAPNLPVSEVPVVQEGEMVRTSRILAITLDQGQSCYDTHLCSSGPHLSAVMHALMSSANKCLRREHNIQTVSNSLLWCVSKQAHRRMQPSHTGFRAQRLRFCSS